MWMIIILRKKRDDDFVIHAENNISEKTFSIRPLFSVVLIKDSGLSIRVFCADNLLVHYTRVIQ